MNAIDRADKAQAILDSPVYKEAFEGVRNALFASIEKCSLKDTDTAEDLRRCLKLLKDVQLNMELMIKDGKVEAFKLAEATNKNPLRNFFR